MNETISRATFVQARIVQLPSGEQFTTDKTGKIGEVVEVEVKRIGLQYATVLKTLDTVISGSENRSKSTSTVLSGRLDDRVDLVGLAGVEFDNCVVNEVPDGMITDYTFKNYTGGGSTIATYIEGSSAVYVDGIRMKLGTDYTEHEGAGKIIFSTIPNAGQVIIIKVRCVATFEP